MSEPIPQETLREWREACERASKLPWKIAGATTAYAQSAWVLQAISPHPSQADRSQVGVTTPGFDLACENLSYAVCAANALPRLLDAYESNQREIAALREAEGLARAIMLRAQEICLHNIEPFKPLHDDKNAMNAMHGLFDGPEWREYAKACGAIDALRERTAELDARNAQGETA